MFQKFKGAFNELIEEQANTIQRQSPTGRDRSQSQRAARPGASPARRPLQRAPNAPQEKADLSGPDPDPATFETDGNAAVDGGSERNELPNIPTTDSTLPKVSVQDAEGKDTGGSSELGAAAQGNEVAEESELPQEVTMKLRKLSKLESKYSELLRAYRKAHARNAAIEPFEAQLRENTPCTSIGEPGALMDYLKQLSQRGDMVMDEFKKVSTEKDDMKTKLEHAELQAREATDRLQRFREHGTTLEGTEGTTEEASSADDSKPTATSSPSSLELKDTSQRSPIISSPRSLVGLLSPKKKPQHVREDSEEVFSYDEEVPRLQEEVEKRDSMISSLVDDNANLKRELSSARESSEHMMHDLENKQTALELSRTDHRNVDGEKNESQAKCAKLETEIEQCYADLETAQARVQDSEEKLHRQKGAAADLEKEVTQLMASQTARPEDPSTKASPNVVATREDPPETQVSASSKSKKNKKKKKGTSGTEPKTAGSSRNTADTSTTNSTSSILEQKNHTIETLNEKLRSHQEVVEEIETLREQLLNVGQEHVEAKERLKTLESAKAELDTRAAQMNNELQILRSEASGHDKSSRETDNGLGDEKSQLEAKVKTLQEERDGLEAKVTVLEEQLVNHTTASQSMSGAHDAVSAGKQAEIDGLKSRVESLLSELKATDGVAQSRFKELGFLQTAAKKSRTDVETLRTEIAMLRGSRDEVVVKTAKVRELESRESRLRPELDEFKQRLSEEESESKRLNERVVTESGRRSNLEEANRKLERDLTRSRKEVSEASTARDSLVQRLRDSDGERTNARSRIHDLEGQLEALKSDISGLRDDISLKSAQHASAQSLMSSLRDQSSEMATQLKEAKERSESLEDELTDAHRLMNERGREGETMRRILSDIESRADSRVKEMRERMDIAVQERDRAEDEASTLGRRRGRELDDLKNKLRDAERDLRRANDANNDLERLQRDLRQKVANDAERVEQSTQEATELRKAMSELRDALDESERQAREVEADKAATQKSLEDGQSRLEKLQKSSKTMTEELRSLRATKARHNDSGAQSSRSSIDSSIPGRVTSPAVNGRDSPKPKSNGTGTVDYVYLKNVLLQFLEQKDRKYQMQLIPVLGMLLRFDKKDEQRWMSVVTTH